MTDHFQEAEKFLSRAQYEDGTEYGKFLASLAQVHATLAMAAAQESLPIPIRRVDDSYERSEGATFSYGVELSKHGTPYEVALTLKGRRIVTPEGARAAAEWYEQWTDGATARPVYRRRLSAFSQWESIDEQ